MDRDVARHVIRTSFQATRELISLLTLLKEHAPADEYRDYARRIAHAIHTVNGALLDPTYAAHPGLQEEVEASVEKYDRFL